MEQHESLLLLIYLGPLSRPSIRKLFPTFVTYSQKLNREIGEALERSKSGIVESMYRRSHNFILLSNPLKLKTLSFVSHSTSLECHYWEENCVTSARNHLHCLSNNAITPFSLSHLPVRS